MDFLLAISLQDTDPVIRSVKLLHGLVPLNTLDTTFIIILICYMEMNNFANENGTYWIIFLNVWYMFGGAALLRIQRHGLVGEVYH